MSRGAIKGHVLSEETKRKISEAHKGERSVWYGKHHTEETRRKISESAKELYRLHPERRILTGSGNRGKKLSEERCTRQSEALKGRFVGENAFNWRGGRVERVADLRSTRDYRIWRRAVLERDDYTCVSCGVKGVILHAHHIISVSVDISRALDISNGETLCTECHQRQHPFNLYFGSELHG